MSASSKPETSRARTRAYRERLRAKGLKPVTIWVPDLSDAAVRQAIVAGCRRLDRSDDEQEVLALVDSLLDEQLLALDELEGK